MQQIGTSIPNLLYIRASCVAPLSVRRNLSVSNTIMNSLPTSNRIVNGRTIHIRSISMATVAVTRREFIQTHDRNTFQVRSISLQLRRWISYTPVTQFSSAKDSHDELSKRTGRPIPPSPPSSLSFPSHSIRPIPPPPRDPPSLSSQHESSGSGDSYRNQIPPASGGFKWKRWMKIGIGLAAVAGISSLISDGIQTSTRLTQMADSFAFLRQPWIKALREAELDRLREDELPSLMKFPELHGSETSVPKDLLFVPPTSDEMILLERSIGESAAFFKATHENARDRNMVIGSVGPFALHEMLFVFYMTTQELIMAARTAEKEGRKVDADTLIQRARITAAELSSLTADLLELLSKESGTQLTRPGKATVHIVRAWSHDLQGNYTEKVREAKQARIILDASRFDGEDLGERIEAMIWQTSKLVNELYLTSGLQRIECAILEAEGYEMSEDWNNAKLKYKEAINLLGSTEIDTIYGELSIFRLMTRSAYCAIKSNDTEFAWSLVDEGQKLVDDAHGEIVSLLEPGPLEPLPPHLELQRDQLIQEVNFTFDALQETIDRIKKATLKATGGKEPTSINREERE